ncbi:MAG: hypothetical protein LBL59_08820 [Xanthomonadaceae bacterium]|jgi:hypothetical protein|nr:hypothetical protein [Xanthomonadaceae bacterium]
MGTLLMLVFIGANFVVIIGALVIFLLGPRPHCVSTHVARISLIGIVAACASLVARDLTATGVIEPEQVILVVALALALVTYARSLAVLKRQDRCSNE